jgi:hypothetical protein
VLVPAGKVAFLVSGFENSSVLYDDAQTAREANLPQELGDSQCNQFGVPDLSAKLEERFVRSPALFHATPSLPFPVEWWMNDESEAGAMSKELFLLAVTKVLSHFFKK